MLTDLACRKAKPKDKPYKLADAQGLHLYVTTTGFKSWRWKYRFAGREKQLALGPYPAVGLVEAREGREAAAKLLRAGVDPSLARRQRKAAVKVAADTTFKSIAIEWIDSQRPRWTPRYTQLIERDMERDVYPKLGKLPIGAITTPMVLEVLRPIERRGAVETAHRARGRISEVFGRAIASGLVDRDPAASAAGALSTVAKGKFPAVTSIEAARKVLATVEGQPAHPTTLLASRLLALTAVRSAVLRFAELAEFEDLDGDAPIWRIPAAKMKLTAERKRDASFDFVVPLSRQAVAVIRTAAQLAGKGQLIFRGVQSGRVPISDSTLSKLYRDAGFGGLHVPHGWRSTFSTVMNEIAGEQNRVGDRGIIDMMLAHKPRGVEGVYNRAAYLPRRRELAQEWADMLTRDLQPPAALIGGSRH